MADEVDDAMAAQWPRIAAAVTDGVALVDPALDAVVPVTKRREDDVVIVDRVDWDEVGGHPGLHRARPLVTSAYRFERPYKYALGQRSLSDVTSWAKSVADRERALVLALLCAERRRTFDAATGRNFLGSLKELGGTSRLLLDRPVEAYPKLSMDDELTVTVGLGVLPAGVHALLLRLDAPGPTVTRVGGGLVASWTRRAYSREFVDLWLTSSFFLADADQVAVGT